MRTCLRGGCSKSFGGSVRGSDAAIVLLLLLSIAVALSYFVIYRLDEIKGAAQMKNTNLFITAMHEKR